LPCCRKASGAKKKSRDWVAGWGGGGKRPVEKGFAIQAQKTTIGRAMLVGNEKCKERMGQVPNGGESHAKVVGQDGSNSIMHQREEGGKAQSDNLPTGSCGCLGNQKNGQKGVVKEERNAESPADRDDICKE